jgi:cell division septation protein DedD
MRDLDRWKDKVEISLDGRQIFFLFFGSAVAACLIFIVGVLIGKRIEARALALQPAPVEDPLAALDQLGDADEADEGLTFHKTLAARSSDKTRADKPAGERGDAKTGERGDKAAKLADAEPQLDEGGEPATVTVTVKDAKAEAKSEAKAEPKSGEAKAEAKNDKGDKADKADKLEAKADAKKPEAKPAAKLPPPPGARPQVVQATPKPTTAKKPDAATVAHFTLQLSAFPDKSDADEFMHKMQAAGYKAFLVASEVPGKGLYYRVRVGDYATRQAAVDAKSEFERKQRIIAYVAKL